MVVQSDSEPKLEQSSGSMASGWTLVHSWIFLAIVAIGFTVIAWQNRYHYLSPLGLGKAYRIDKLFGGIQEFDPATGWVTAQLQIMGPPQAMSMMEQPPSGSQAVPMNMPGPARPNFGESQLTGAPEVRRVEPFAQERERELPKTQVAAQSPPTVPGQNLPQPQEMTKEEKLASFRKFFPEFGQDEFQLANDDLYPDWKNRFAPTGNWNQFLPVYKSFVQWWNDTGSPPEPGLKLWKDFLASGGSSR